jgi:SAM-dependent methyltransferase
VEGELACRGCGATFPIARGVPRFVSSGGYAGSFGRQWHWFREVQIDSLNRTTVSEDTLRATTGWRDDAFRGRRLLDAGVGAGRFAEQAAARGAEVFGIDLTQAVDAAYETIGHRPNVHLAQADIFALPFRPGTFDLAYSIGVLHHTPDPPEAFARVAETVAPGGRLAIYVYSRYGPAHRMSDALRVVTTRLPLPVMWVLAAAAVPLYFLYRTPVLGKAFNLALPISMEPRWRWRWLDTFDWYTPKYQAKYLYPEVFRWFRDNGLDVVDLPDGPVRVAGTKRANGVSVDGARDYSRLVAS